MIRKNALLKQPEPQMKFYTALGFAEFRPPVTGQTKTDDGSIYQINASKIVTDLW
jgi:hypothetical protein